MSEVETSSKTYPVQDNEIGTRIDTFLETKLEGISRSSVKKLIEAGDVTVNEAITKVSYKLREDDLVKISTTQIEKTVDTITLPIIYEDDNVIVIDKPAGVLTHSKGSFNKEGTVASFIEPRIQAELRGNRSGIVHRLDRDTSGVIICAKTEEAQTLLQKQFSQRKAKKTYVAVVHDTPKIAEAIMKWPIGRNPKKPQTFRVDVNGKTAETHYTVKRSNDEYSLLELKPTTGRTHQLRVHLLELGNPIVGDRLYGEEAERMYLHAKQLELTLPGGERRVFSSPVPSEFKELV